MIDRCEGCGACCDPVSLPYTQNEVRQIPPWDPRYNRRDSEWILNDLTEIPYREGLERAPHLAGEVLAKRINGELVMVNPVFYECRHYDGETKRCMNWAHRPPTCEGYPWYDAPPDRTKALPRSCDYRRDVGEVPVQLVQKPATPATDAT